MADPADTIANTPRDPWADFKPAAATDPWADFNPEAAEKPDGLSIMKFGPVPIPVTQAFHDRIRKGWQNYLGDVADIFMEGVHTTLNAPLQIVGGGPSITDDLHPEIEKQLAHAGASPEQAKAETERLVREYRRQEAMQGLLFGPIQAITAPLNALYRSFVSRPLEEEAGIPKEVTETAAIVAAAAFGMRPGHTVARVKIDPQTGAVHTQAIGELPKSIDFTNAADVLSRESPIAQFRRDAAAIEATLPPVEEGSVRLWRGNRAGEAGTAFTNDLPGIALPFRKVYGGDLAYVDVPAADLPKYENRAGTAPGAEFNLPAELASKAKTIAAQEGAAAPAIDPRAIETKLRELWEERGIHPAEAVHDAQRDPFFKQELLRNDGVTWTPTKVAPVQSTPVPEGTPRSELAKTGEAHVDKILDSAVTKRAIDNAVINDQYDVPYSAGGSVPMADPTMYIDRHFPRSMEIDGVRFDPAEPFTIHENVEQHVMELLIKGGMKPEEAYRVAHFEFAERAEGAWYKAHGIDQAKAEAAYRPFIDAIQHDNPERPPPNLYVKPYPHDDVRAAKGEPLAEPGPTRDEIRRAKEILAKADEEGEFRPLGADIMTTPLPPLDAAPTATPGGLVARGRTAIDQIFGLGRSLEAMLDPMAANLGTSGALHKQAMVIAKDTMNLVRRIRYDWLRTDQEIMRRFNAEQQKVMWDRLDEESVAIQLGESREHQGLVTLDPAERRFVEMIQDPSQAAWLHARDVGMVEGEGLPAYAPRMMINIAMAGESLSPRALNELGRQVFTRTGQMLHRKHMMAEETEAAAQRLVGMRMAERGASVAEIEAAQEKVKIARTIRALPLATARLEEAAVWKTMINKIREVGKAAGADTVADYQVNKNWFTIAGNPAFTEWKPMFRRDAKTGEFNIVKNENGEVVFEPRPIWMPPEFKGPMRSILEKGPAHEMNIGGVDVPTPYGALMALKGKAMTAILNSPLIHNEVVLSKVMEAVGFREKLGFGLYSRGNRIAGSFAHPARARELIEAGLNPMGPRGAIQDITAMMEEPTLTPGRSLTSSIVSAIPDLFSPKAGDAVRRAIDRAGNFVHNTLLWDRVRDLQFGLADFLSDKFMNQKGVDRLTADRIASHISNIIVGSLPKEMMSAGATAAANMLMFSRSFTLGNLATYKQAIVGLPKPILAQLERDYGLRAEAEGATPPTPEALAAVAQDAKSIARRKAVATIALSAGMFYIGNALLQNALNVTLRDSTLEEEWRDYVRRLKDEMEKIKGDPTELASLVQHLSPTADNEPSKSDRAHIGYTSDGTAVYARNPMGKFGEEMVGYPTMPMEMVRRKLSPSAAGLLDILTNDKGFGRKVYEEHDKTIMGDIKNAFAVAKHLVMRHLPEQQIQAATDLLKDEGDKDVNKLRLLGPVFGFTASVGAPGGQPRGEAFEVKNQLDERINLYWQDIKKQVQRGDIDGARDALDRLHIPPGIQRGLIRNAQNPSGALRGRTLRDFYQSATPEQIERFNRAQERQPLPQP